MTVKPYTSEGSKKKQVAGMFNNIAPKYDFLNHFLSLGIDKIWRKRAINLLKSKEKPLILDVATGTGDLALQAHQRLGCQVVGIDISTEMLKVAQEKIEKRGLSDVISVQEADSENLPFDDNHFDAVMVAFGVRNFENLNKGLTDMARTLKPGGKMVVLEFSKPAYFPFKQLYLFYFRYILPWLGGAISNDKAAYTYLPESVLSFPDGQLFDDELVEAGMRPVKRYKQTMGIATIYLSEKPAQ
ncbi:bifunctional demethylmenaquinone methyltransferase/2-methoxy-6-polyprenyl-1,4-benzoquinol methylase UbiE [Carboxylicivirga sp. M1479]|uniref:bifunctional demethylmenaquinone methyltransferase/2-methoxy-6-polyprenyl-1,4-benzoquinol methylase UbiE n=1 Tax=Carboxylicivirga sp. M1479 TaxID=2594476 RepID=UPI001178C466|nr:bifunctional demethylmenaquinone methyltransferase/2-methoxy-6-polyprenyl-1,4-benzoquinol methylase UbiE [Carboxylicivirga sp. M1479]TRX64329.1 bifunctional demethylmenaquinone methyltransferase/2-methoxy-6-polyprenyl-1,4-benzoquinol methylase UbiE [Carboxylicivirga sp. M1479]